VASAALDSLSLEYREEGAGPPVVFVHGGISDLRSWEAQMPIFSQSHRAVSSSRRLHWPTSLLPRTPRIQRLCMSRTLRI